MSVFFILLGPYAEGIDSTSLEPKESKIFLSFLHSTFFVVLIPFFSSVSSSFLETA